MNAIEKIISQMNEAAEQERAALEQEERMKIDQNFEQKRTQIETDFYLLAIPKLTVFFFK